MKLEGIPHIIYLNSKHHPTQDARIKENLDYYGVKYERYEKEYTTKFLDLPFATFNDLLTDDYSDQGFGEYVSGSTDYSHLREDELALTLDNYNAIVKWYDNSDDDVCIIMDDSVRLDMSQHWQFDWRYAYLRLPYNWDCIQLFANSHSEKIKMNLHPWIRHSKSTRCYMITRLFAKKVKRFHYDNGKFRLHYRCKDKLIPSNEYGSIETNLFNLGVTYKLPLFNLDENAGFYIDSNTTESSTAMIKRQRDLLSSDSIKYWWTTVASHYSLDEQFSYGRDEEWKMEVSFDMQCDHVHMTKKKMLIWI